MTRNVGTPDRLARLLAAAALFTCSVMAPLPLLVRVFGLGAPALYMVGTALFGSCLGYRMMGKSTCPTTRPS